MQKKSFVTVRFGHLEISASTSRPLHHQHRYSNIKIVLQNLVLYIFVKNNIFGKLQPMGRRLATFLENE